ncbi:MAG: hypothetical protein ABL997_06405 [Planctomycetota bacterium]
MSYDPRTISFSAEILYPPVQLRADLVQGVHNTLFRQPSLGYQSFQIAPDGCHLTNLPQTPGQVSSLSFLADRMVLREEFRATTIEDFATRVVNVAGIAFSALSIPISIAQQFCVRSLIAPKHPRDGREFLAKCLLARGDALTAFGRTMQGLGLRFTFPPCEQDRALHQVRVESWPQDARSLWLEVTSTYPAAIAAAQLPSVQDQLYATYGFLTGPVADYLAGHDQP